MDNQIQTFHEQGYVVVRNFIQPTTVQYLREAFTQQTKLWAQEVGVSTEEYLSVVSQWTNIWEHNTRFQQQLHNPKAAKLAAELLSCQQVRVFHDHLIAKPPQGGSTIPWHRDFPNWPIAKPNALSCWIALDDASKEAGAMRFMPKGHKESITPSIDFLNEEKDWGAREQEAVSIPVKAGDAIFHHCLSWHSSPPNQTNAWRRAYIAIYMDAKSTFLPSRASWHPMVHRVSVQSGETFNNDVFPIIGSAS